MDVKEEVRRYLEEDAIAARLAVALGEYQCCTRGVWGEYYDADVKSVSRCVRPKGHSGRCMIRRGWDDVDGYVLGEIDSKD